MASISKTKERAAKDWGLPLVREITGMDYIKISAITYLTNSNTHKVEIGKLVPWIEILPEEQGEKGPECVF